MPDVPNCLTALLNLVFHAVPAQGAPGQTANTCLCSAAAYISSYNKPTVDRQIFDVKTRTGRIRGRCATMDSDRQVQATNSAVTVR